MAAHGVRPGATVVLPANASHGLVEAVRSLGARPRFRPFGADLGPVPAEASFAWSQPVGGLAGGSDRDEWRDCADALPDLTACWDCVAREGGPAVALFGLHLAVETEASGALILCDDIETAERCRAALAHDEPLDWGAAAAQCRRLVPLSRAQRDVLAEMRTGLVEAAGVPLAPDSVAGGLPHGVAVRVPDEAEPTTFRAYLSAEHTVARWLSDLRPIHYAAFRGDDLPLARAAAAELSRWLLLPAGPAYTSEEIAHAVLGVVKTAEYLGVRWRTDPERAAAYAAELTACYGPEHDAYRPAFL